MVSQTGQERRDGSEGVEHRKPQEDGGQAGTCQAPQHLLACAQRVLTEPADSPCSRSATPQEEASLSGREEPGAVEPRHGVLGAVEQDLLCVLLSGDLPHQGPERLKKVRNIPAKH